MIRHWAFMKFGVTSSPEVIIPCAALSEDELTRTKSAYAGSAEGWQEVSKAQYLASIGATEFPEVVVPPPAV